MCPCWIHIYIYLKIIVLTPNFSILSLNRYLGTNMCASNPFQYIVTHSTVFHLNYAQTSAAHFTALSLCEQIQYRDSNEDWHEAQRANLSQDCHGKVMDIDILKCAPQTSPWTFKIAVISKMSMNKYTNQLDGEIRMSWPTVFCIVAINGQDSIASPSWRAEWQHWRARRTAANSSTPVLSPSATQVLPIRVAQGIGCHSRRLTGSCAGLTWQQLEARDGVWKVQCLLLRVRRAGGQAWRTGDTHEWSGFESLSCGKAQTFHVEMKHLASFQRGVLPLL